MLVIGLGNPGTQYELTRHNIGFRAVCALAEKYGFSWQQHSKLCGYLASGIHQGNKLILLKPTTYMNNSGMAVAQVKNYYKIELEDIVVLHDELDLESGLIKHKIGGGSAGHNGIKSIDQAIGNSYHRIRIGIDKPLDRDQVSDYVLSNFTNSEKKILDEAIIRIADNFDVFLDGDLEKFKHNIGNKE